MKTLSATLIALMFCSALLAQKDEYFHPNFKQIARNHHSMAVLPFKFTIQMLKKDQQELTEEQIATMEKIDGQLFQSSVYNFLKEKEDGRGLKVELQNVNITNEKLEEAGITAEDVTVSNIKRIAEILDVDALIFGHLKTAEPFSEAAVLAVRVASFGMIGLTAHDAKGIMQISDGQSGNLLWRYNIKLKKGAQSSSDAIIRKIMKKSSRNIPYIGK